MPTPEQTNEFIAEVVGRDLQTAGIGKGTPGPGRPKGLPNKATKAVKAAIAEAAEGLGGTDRLIAWAQEDKRNESAFWVSIYPKLLPLQLAGELAVSVSEITRRIIK